MAVIRLFQGYVEATAFTKTLMIAIIEELIFRYWLQRKIEIRFGEIHAIGWSSVLFTLIHTSAYGLSMELLGVFVLSCAIGTIYASTKQLWLAVLFHVCVNVWMYGSMAASKSSRCAEVNVFNLTCTQVTGLALLTILGISLVVSIARLAYTITSVRNCTDHKAC
jgi:membrane protease YdiL (CAAX protease family)